MILTALKTLYQRVPQNNAIFKVYTKYLKNVSIKQQSTAVELSKIMLYK